MGTRHFVLVCVSILLCGGACGVRAAQTNQSPDPPSAEAQESSEAVLKGPVSFTRVGGFAGFDDRLEILPDGTTTATKRLPSQGTETRATKPDALEELAERLHACGLFDQNHEFVSPGVDQITYTIVYDGVTVTAMDGELPSELVPVVMYLSQILDSAE